MATFKIQLSDFSIVPRPRGGLKSLRFSLTLAYESDTMGKIGMLWEGCLATRWKNGRLSWSPPRIVYGPMAAKRYLWATPDLYQHVCRVIEESDYAKKFLTVPDSVQLINDLAPDDDTIFPGVLTVTIEKEGKS